MNEENNSQALPKIDLNILLSDLLQDAKHFLWLLILMALLLGSFFGWKSYRSYVPLYQATSTFTVNVTNPLYSNVISYNSTLAEQMADTFPAILSSGVLQDKVKEKLNIRSLPRISASVVKNANIFTLTVTSPDPELAHQVLEAVIEFYPEIAEFVVGPTLLQPLNDSGVPQTPINTLSIRSGVVKGLVLSAGIWLLILLVGTFANSTIHNETDLKHMTSISCLGSLPMIKSKKGVDKVCPMIREGSDPTGFSDSVRLMGLHVEKELDQHQAKVLLVSSAIPGEGKTTVASNLAAVLAAHGRRVLIVDLDLRNPSVHRAYGMSASEGLTSFLNRGQWEPQKTLTAISHDLFAIFAGNPVQNASKLLSQPGLRKLIASARNNFDYILLDTPPCGLLADAGDVADMADAALLIIRQSYSSRDQILEAAQFLSESNLPLIGCILNGVRRDMLASPHSYGYGYGYGYGYHKSYKSND